MGAKDGTSSTLRVLCALSCTLAVVMWFVPAQAIALVLAPQSCCRNRACQCARKGRACHCGHTSTTGWEAVKPACGGDSTRVGSVPASVVCKREASSRAITHEYALMAFTDGPVHALIDRLSERSPPPFVAS